MWKAELIITLGTILSLLPSLPKYILHRRPLTIFACGSIQIFGEEIKHTSQMYVYVYCYLWISGDTCRFLDTCTYLLDSIGSCLCYWLSVKRIITLLQTSATISVLNYVDFTWQNSGPYVSSYKLTTRLSFNLKPVWIV